MGGFVREGSSDDYVLLGGGGHKPISDFADASHSHNYLPLSGGTMDKSATITFPSDQTGTYAFKKLTFYNNFFIDINGNLLFDTTATDSNFWNVGQYMGSGANATWLFTVHHNGNVGIGTTSPTCKLDIAGVFRNCYEGDPGSGAVTAKILSYKTSPYGIVFRSYASGVNSIQVQREANQNECFGLSLNPLGGNVGIGNTSPSYKLDVTGQVGATGFIKSGSSDSYVLLGGGGHKLLSEIAGGASGDYLPKYGSSFYFNMDADMPETASNIASLNAAHRMTFYRNAILMPYQMNDANDGGFIRSRGTSESSAIFEVGMWDDSGAGETIQFNYYPTTSTVTPTYSVTVPKKSGTIALLSDISGASSGNYLPLTGGTMSGTLNMTADTVQMNFRTGHSSYNSKLEYMTYGDEALVWANQNAVTSFIFKCGLNLTNTNNWTGITPSMQIKNQSVYINSLIGHATSPSYNLYVNGTGRFTSSLTVDSNLSVKNGDFTIWSPQNYTYLPKCTFVIENIEWARIEMDTSANFHFKHGASTDNTYKRIYAASFNQGSDMRKKNIVDNVNINIYNIANAPLFKFTWKDESKYSGLHIGSSAQYWQTMLPELVNVIMDTEQTLTMQYDVIALVSTITVAKKVVELEQDINILKSENKDLRKQIEELKTI